MAVRFSDDQVVQATAARRVQPGARASYEAVCTDTRKLTPGSLFVALVGETHDAHLFLKDAVAGGAAGAVVQAGKQLPPLPRDFAVFEVKDTLHALGGLAKFHRQRFRIPIGAVTGSNGKTTTKEMVGAILATRGPALKTEGNLNNEIGVPLTLFGLEPSHVAAIIEMGMNNPGEISRLTAMTQPDAGLITIVQPAHLKGLGSIEGVARAKGELFEGLGKTAVAVVNGDDPHVVAQVPRTQATRMTYGRFEQADVRLVSVQSRGKDGMLLVIRAQGAGLGEHRVQLPFLGEHNAMNATGAFALALALGYRADECVRGLENAKPYARRLNWVEAPGGVTVIDDCYNANPASMNAALETVQALAQAQGGRALAVLGDMLELGEEESREHRALGEVAARKAARIAFFGPRSSAGFEAAGPQHAAHFTEIEPLLAWLKPQLQERDLVLVKGSRGMKLERVVQALSGQAAGGAH